MKIEELEVITLGSGCFWCVEAVFKEIRGVESAVSGYSGGMVKNPTYKQVCEGTTGHAEVLQITFDQTEVSFEEILEVFWNTHDPTTLNRQGNDIGTQYRSVIFYHNDRQKEIAEKYMMQLDKSEVYKDKIVTEITSFDTFYPAEDYHTNYFALHGEEPYCGLVIKPKVEKFKKKFADKLK